MESMAGTIVNPFFGYRGCKKNNDGVWEEQVDTTAASWLDRRYGGKVKIMWMEGRTDVMST